MACFFQGLALFILEIFYFVILMQEVGFEILDLVYHTFIYVQWFCLWRLTSDLFLVSAELDKYFFNQEYCCENPIMQDFLKQDLVFNFTSFQSEWI